MNVTDFLVAFLAGTLTTLSPCVLPVLPLVLATSLKAGKRGPILFALGLLITFVATTWLLSRVGTVIGLDQSGLRMFSGIALIISAIWLVSERVQAGLSKCMNPLINAAAQASTKIESSKSKHSSGVKELILGALTGVIWTPCSGPSLGIAIGLAAERENPAQAAALLGLFGVGAVVPLLVIAYGSQTLLRRRPQVDVAFAKTMKYVLGVLILAVGIGIMSGLDKSIEAFLVGISPDWLTDLTTRF